MSTTTQYKINHAVYSEQEKLDENQTIAKFTREHKAWRELQAKDSNRITEALNQAYASHPEASLNKPALITTVLAKIGFNPDTYSELSDRVVRAIDAHPRLYTQVGKGGGVKMMNDEQLATFKASGKYPFELAREEKKEKEEKAKAAKAAAK